MLFRSLYANRSRILRKGLWVAGTTSGAYVLDQQLNNENFTRSLRTVAAGVMIVADYKLCFNEYFDITKLHTRVATRIYDVCSANGGLYIKFAQALSTMNHLLPEEYYNILSKLHDMAPYEDYDTVVKIFRQEFGKAPEEMFDEFQKIPVASASIAQVHKARRKDTGEWVAVKVQKPQIQASIPFDLFMHRVVLTAFEYLFELPLLWSAEYIEHHLIKESDFMIEGRNAEHAMRDFKDNPAIYIPKIHWDATSTRIMTMEWVDGIKITNAEKLKAQGFSIKDVMKKTVEAFSHQIFVSGHLHCDPHPGNILVRNLHGNNGKPQPASSYLLPWKRSHSKPEPQIILLDHGLYIDESPSFRIDYCRLWEAMFLLDTKTLSEICIKWGIQDPDLFASAQLLKPFNPSKAVHLGSVNIAPSEVFKMQVEAKDRIKRLLKDTEKLPMELIFIGRNLNLVRGNNKILGSPVNRINIMAEYAVRGIDAQTEGQETASATRQVQQWARYVNFKSRLFVMSMVYQLAQWRKWVGEVVLGEKDVGGFEDALEEEMNKRMSQFGLRRIDKSMFNS